VYSFPRVDLSSVLNPSRAPTDLFSPPPALRTDGSNAFARHSMAVRVPGIIREVLDRNPDYTPAVQDAFRKLHDEVEGDAPLRLFALPSPDYDLWRPFFEPHSGESWLNTDWFFAEMLVYRLMMDAGDYWSTLRDPFAPLKRDELASDALWEAVTRALESEGSLDERLELLLAASLWGNRIDLSLKSTAAMGVHALEEHLLANDIPVAVELLVARAPGPIHFIMDNAGTEQALDLVLADAILEEGIATSVTLHVKMHPVLVSDATTHDVHELLGAMTNRGGDSAALAERIRGYMGTKRLSLVPDFFWTTPGRMWELPARLLEAFSDALLVIAKGDVNYRRMTNDAIWSTAARLVDALEPFPAPLLALRTLKSDTLIGVGAETIEYMNRTASADWRTSGAYGVAQIAI
jgi:uncharacterized protein with ATP-grasp and redox domains